MTTMLAIVTGALKRLRVTNPRKTLDSISATDGLTALNDMMFAWKGHGVDTDHSELELADDFPLDDEHIQGTKALLALRLAGEYGLAVPADVQHDAANGWQALQNEFIESPADARSDDLVAMTSSGRWWW